MTDDMAMAGYRRALGDGLIQRWSTIEDVERIAQLEASVFRRREEDPIRPGTLDFVRRLMRERMPMMGPGDFALVEDTSRPDCPVVAAACLWRHEWLYEGIHFGVGRPESVVADPAYRNRGLIRALFEMLHARCAAEGLPVQAITGIPYFYRQFGYEYALDLGGRHVVYTSHIPQAPEGKPEPYALRNATEDDAPYIASLYDRRAAAYAVSMTVPEAHWRYRIRIWQQALATGKDVWDLALGDRIMVVVDEAGDTCGFVALAGARWGRDLPVYILEMEPRVSLPAAVPSLLRALAAYGRDLPVIGFDVAPFSEISFQMARHQPIAEILGRGLAPVEEPPYAWYVRVPDLPAFIRLIAPALERRLAESAAAHYTGELIITLYRSGLRMVFEDGRMTAVEPWRAPAFASPAAAGFPPLVFLQALFGHRSLDELRYAYPDVWANNEARPLIRALFPARPSWVLGL